MRFARRLVMLAVMACAAMAFAAPSAFSQVEVVDEDTGSHCNPTCSVHAANEGTADLAQHTGTSEVVFSQCVNEFEAAITEAGVVTIDDADASLSGPLCGRQPCAGVDWTGDIEESGAGLEDLDITFCLEPAGGGADTVCSVSNLAISQSGTHDYEITAVDSPCTNLGGVIELTGTWHITQDAPGHQDIEIIH